MPDRITESATMYFSRRIVARLNQSPLIDNFVYTARHGPARGLRRQGGMGWLPSFFPRIHEWDREEAFLANLGWQGLTVYDVGGDQGLFSLFFARRVGEAGRVIVFEPNPRSCRRIEQNIQLNNFENVRVIPVGLAERRARLPFVFPLSEPARGSAIPAVGEQMKQTEDAIRCEIEVNGLDDEIERSALPPPHFIKIDVEGMEYVALKGMPKTLATFRPSLSIEIHGVGVEQKTANVKQVVALLTEHDYQIRHIESGERITTANAERAREGHIYCQHKTKVRESI